MLLFAVVVLLGLTWYFSRNWQPLVEARLQEVVRQSTGGLYTLKYDRLDLNIALGNASLYRAELIPDSAVYQDMILRKVAPNNRYHIKIDELKVRRFSLKD